MEFILVSTINLSNQKHIYNTRSNNLFLKGSNNAHICHCEYTDKYINYRGKKPM